MKKLLIALAVLIVLTIGLMIWLHREVTITKSLFSMGTIFEITASGSNPEQAIADAFQEIKRIEAITSNQAGFELAKINQAAGVHPVRISPDLTTILAQVTQSYSDLSGAFDPTVGPLIDLWGFGPQGEPKLPAPSEIKRVLPLVGFNRISLDLDQRTIFLPAKGMKLDLGGIAKGYAVDRAYQRLQKSGIRSALINGGSSSIRTIGKRNGQNHWRLGIGHPRQPVELLGTLTLSGERALATSADNQNFFIHRGQRYSHLIDPRTGYPAQDKILVTVIAPTALEADLLSTAFFLLPLAKIKAFITAKPEYTAIIYDSEGKLVNLNEPSFKASNPDNHES